jgi:hypothetical protein
MPREGHLKRCLRLFGYLKHNAKHRIKQDLQGPNYHGLRFIEHEWKEHYPEAGEEIDKNTPPAVTKNVKITVYVDASHGCDLVT